MAYRLNSPSVVSETIDGEALIVNLENGNYYSARGTAEAVWALVSVSIEVDDAILALACRFTGDPESIGADTHTFLETLVTASLLVPGAAGENGAAPANPGAEKSPWAVPELQEYTDMQDLITLDPIHDVGHEGWPNAAPAQE